MINYFIKSVLRNIRYNKIYSLLNFLGLSIGIAAFLLLFLWIKDELSYNKFNENYYEIYRLYSEYDERDNTWQTQLTPDLAAPLLIEQYPSIMNAVRLKNQPSTIKVGESLFNEDGLYYTDPSFFEIFTTKSIYGSPIDALNDPNSIVITNKIASKYFGDINPINQSVLIDGRYEFKIAAVIEKFPNSSDIQFDILCPYKFLENNNLMWQYWSFGRIETYVLCQAGVSKDKLDLEIRDFVEDKGDNLGFIFKGQPLEQVHLYTLTGEKEGMKSVQIFALIALGILIIACFNFINLTTAQYTKRAKGISLKQILGSSKWNLIKYIFFETLFFVVISGLVALIFIELFRIPFNTISGKELQIIYHDIIFIAYLFIIFFVTSLLSALYPAYFVTKFKALNILTGELTKGIRGRKIRQAIVIIQFSISIVLVIASITTYRQFNYILNKNSGYNTSNVVYIPIKGEARRNLNTFKAELKNSAYIENVTAVSELPSFVGIGTSNFDYEGKDPSDDKGFTILSVDHDFIKAADLKLNQGRDFSLDYSADSSNYILNQTAIDYMGLENPIGSRFRMFRTEGKIIGVVDDFHFMPLNQEIGPIFLAIIPNYYAQILIRIKEGSTQEGLQHIEKVWKSYIPEYAFEYNFWDDFNGEMYGSERQLINIFLYFTFLAILIASLGLVGLSMFTTEIKTKEIGIRKTTGAKTTNIVVMFIKDYSKWIIVSIVISCPIAYYLMNKWLQNYAYRTGLSVWIFIASILLVYIIGILSIIIQSYRSAKANPVDSLRYE